MRTLQVELSVTKPRSVTVNVNVNVKANVTDFEQFRMIVKVDGGAV